MVTWIVGFLIVAAMMLGGGLATDTSGWFRDLRKPSWNPPNWLFAPAWTVILTLAGWSGVNAWSHAGTGGVHLRLSLLFSAVVILHLLWSPLFFKLRRPDLSLMEIPLLWIAILATMVGVAGISALSAWLLAPYLAWVSFATFLNLTIVRLNAPFHAGAQSGRNA